MLQSYDIVLYIFLLQNCQLFFLFVIITINCCIIIAALVANKVSYIKML